MSSETIHCIVLSSRLTDNHFFASLSLLRERMLEEEKQKVSQEISRRANPRSGADFAVLYNELDTWRNTELTKIKVRSVVLYPFRSTRNHCFCSYVCVLSMISLFPELISFGGREDRCHVRSVGQ